MNKSPALVLPLLLLLQLLLAAASPIRYDQRQEGDSNVDARLQNFFVVLAPSNMGQLGGASLLDLASKAVPLRLRPQAHGDSLKQREEPDTGAGAQGQESKEGKSGRAVNTLTIPAAILQSPLAKLHPDVQAIAAVEEVLIAQSPVVALKSPSPGPVPAAVPMLVAVPVPEVAPERPAAPPALLPMNTALPAALGDKMAAPQNTIPEEDATDALDTPPASLLAALEAAKAAEGATPSGEPAQPAMDVAPVFAEAVQPAVETNQVEPEIPKNDVEPQDMPIRKIHLIGTAIEECGPERVRNEEGVCVDDVQRVQRD